LASYENRVRADIERWTQSGLIDRPTAQRLSDDIGKNAGRSISFGGVLGVMASVLLGASVLLFIGANWELIPRLARVLGLFALIFASYVGGAFLKSRDHNAFGEALYLLGAAAFGASIALIGQMYHMSGDETGAVLIWCLATIVAAIGLRSPILTNAAVVLAVGWMFMRGFDWNGRTSFPHLFLLLGAVIWAVSYWTKSAAARHLLLLSIFLYALLLGFDTWKPAAVGATLALLSVGVFLAAHFAPEQVERFAKLGGPYPAHSLVGFLVGIGMVQAEVLVEFGPMLLTTLIAFAGIVAALLMRGRQSRLMRWIAYAAFTIELAFLYIVTLGTMIDTAGLFLFSGVALAAVAFFIMRVERRLSVQQQGAAS
jgi:uncharacterized membrane protein